MCDWNIWEFFIFSISLVDVKILICFKALVCVYKLAFLNMLNVYDLTRKFILCRISVPCKIFWILGFVEITDTRIIIIFLNFRLFNLFLNFVVQKSSKIWGRRISFLKQIVIFKVVNYFNFRLKFFILGIKNLGRAIPTLKSFIVSSLFQNIKSLFNIMIINISWIAFEVRKNICLP